MYAPATTGNFVGRLSGHFSSGSPKSCTLIAQVCSSDRVIGRKRNGRAAHDLARLDSRLLCLADPMQACNGWFEHSQIQDLCVPSAAPFTSIRGTTFPQFTSQLTP